MAVTLRATSELVAQAWLATLPGITSSMVATALPKDASSWAATGFYTVTVVGGNSGLDLPIHNPLIQIDAWAVNIDNQRPPWGRDDQMAQLVVDNCYGDKSRPATLTLTSGPSTGRATLRGAWSSSEPTRLYGDDSSYARKRTDVTLSWTA